MHYFMFSSGSYSDYCVGGLYVCDHEVSEEEYQEFAKGKREAVREFRYAKILQHAHRTGATYIDFHDGRVETKGSSFYSSAECDEYEKFREENDAETAFIALHNMTGIPYTEMHDY